MSVSIAGRAQIVYVVGDSNGLIFGNLICSTARIEAIFAIHSLYVQNFNLRTIVDESGVLNIDLRRQLHDRFVIPSVDDVTPISLNAAIMNMMIPHVARMGEYDRLENPPFIVSVGHMDCARILMQLGPAADFTLPNVPHGPSAVEAIGTTHPSPSGLVHDLLRTNFDRLERALTSLRDSGFGKVGLLGLRPPTLDDERFMQYTKVHSSAHLRYKVTLWFNALASDLCARLGVSFIDIWPVLSENGVFNEAYELDYLHYNRLGAERILATCLGQFLPSSDGV